MAAGPPRGHLRDAMDWIGLPRIGLALKITLAAALTTLLSIAALTIYMSRGNEEVLVQRDTERLAHIHDASVSEARSSMGFYRDDTLLLAKTPPALGIFRAQAAGGTDPLDGSTTQLWRDRFAIIFTSMIEARPEYVQVRYIGMANEGREIVRVDRMLDGTIRRVPEGQLQPKAHRPYFQNAAQLESGSVHISPIELNREFEEIELPHRPVVRFATPVRDGDDALLGIIVINVDMKRMFASMNEGLADTAELFIANEEGDYLEHPQQDKVFGFDLGQRFLMQDDFPELAGLFDDSEERYLGIIDAGEGKLLMVASRVQLHESTPDRYLVVGEMQSAGVLSESLSTVRSEALAVAAAVMLFGLLATALLVRLLLKPVNEITAMADNVARGDRQVEMGQATDRQDEVGVLARSFETMVREVEAREDALRLSEARTNQVIDVMPDAIILVDGQGLIRRVNEQAIEIFGHQRDALLGEPVEMLIPDRFRHGHARHRDEYWKDPQIRTIGAGRDLFALHRDGHEIPVEIAVAPLGADGDGHLVVSVIDITEHKAAADALRASNEKLSRTLETNKELAQFAYVASHDLQEPLRMVDSYMGLLKRRYGGQLGKDADEFIGFAVDGARRMKRLISDLLEYSRVSNRPLRIAPVDLNKAVEDVLIVLRDKIDQAGGKIEVAQLPTLPADAGQIERLLTNLVGNAIKFRGEEAPLIRIAAERRGRRWEITIADNGIGIEPEFRKKVFEIFSRLHERSEFDGTGIGLAACKRIVEMHGGTIWVDAAPKGGSVFHFTLPDDV